MMIRRSVVSVVVVLLLAAATVGTQETLRITPFINENRVVVSFELNDAYNDGVREAIASGLRTTFSYELQLRTPAWIDRTIGTTVVASVYGKHPPFKLIVAVVMASNLGARRRRWATPPRS